MHGGDKISEYFDPDILEMEIREEFARAPPHPLPEHHRQWFSYTSVDQILSKTGFDQRLWLTTAINIRADVLHRLETDGYLAMCQLFHQWLETANPELDQPA